MRSANIPFGIRLISAFHAFFALSWVSMLFMDLPQDALEADEHGFFAAITVAVVVMATIHTAVAIGLWNGKRVALLGAIVLASLHVLPLTIGLVASIPMGHFSEFAIYLIAPLAFHGGILGYLAFNQNVRKVFR